jgi:phosphonate transport system ATP-binding protein
MIRIENLSKIYSDGTVALKNISLQIARGEFITVLGKSGSGKSTLLRCLNQLVQPSSGKIYISGEEVLGNNPGQLKKMRRKMGMIFQNCNLVKESSVLTNVLAGRLGYLSSGASLLGRWSEKDIQTALGHLNDLGLAEKSYSPAGTLSGGQSQRVGIARALMQEPEIILADEPVASLDPETARSIMEILRDINHKKGTTLICNLHQPALAEEFGTRTLILENGELVPDKKRKNL